MRRSQVRHVGLVSRLRSKLGRSTIAYNSGAEYSLLLITDCKEYNNLPSLGLSNDGGKSSAPELLGNCTGAMWRACEPRAPIEDYCCGAAADPNLKIVEKLSLIVGLIPDEFDTG